VGDVAREGAAVLAVSIDTPEAQRRLAEELKVTFALLSDPRMSVIRSYEMIVRAVQEANT
jgi:peroxiredoxin